MDAHNAFGINGYGIITGSSYILHQASNYFPTCLVSTDNYQTWNRLPIFDNYNVINFNYY
jgi:hypothetical protein